MRLLIMSLMAAVMLALPAKADEAAIRSVISSQIEAFEADDLDRAFGYASPMIHHMFRTPERFGAMVQRGYPMVWRPAKVDFLSVEMKDGWLWQTVMIRDQAGNLHLLDYQMLQGENGWKINAVRLREVAGTV